MKWFKHYSDNQRGQSIQALLDEMGHTGLCYYPLVEMCVEKLDPSVERSIEKGDCLFKFHSRVVRQNLRISPANLRRLLDICAANGLLSFQFSGNSLELSMPILLNLLDSDSKKARQTREKNATKSRLEKEKEKEIYIKEDDNVIELKRFDFDAIYQKYPKKEGKTKGLEKCRAQIKTQEEYNLLWLAVDRYVDLKKNEDPKFLKKFDTFMTSWRDWLDDDAGQTTVTKSSTFSGEAPF